MSKKKILGIILLFAVVLTILVLVAFPGTASAANNVLAEKIGVPLWNWLSTSTASIWASSAWQTYIAPYDWAISGIVFLIVGLVVIPKLVNKVRGRVAPSPRADLQREIPPEPPKPVQTPSVDKSTEESSA